MKAVDRIRAAEAACRDIFEGIDARELVNTLRVLDAFQLHQVASRHFSPTEGYGYDDIGRDTLEKVLATLFRAEAAILRPHIASGTAALSLGLFGLLLPGDHLLSACGDPYDTMAGVIGLDGPTPGSLRELGVTYSKVAPAEHGGIDLPAVMAALRPETRVILLQRSRGYAWRSALTPEAMAPLFAAVKRQRPDIYLFVDNCYGAFVTTDEPTFYRADCAVGSLIKNLGGGLAPTGGYLVGSRRAIDRIAARLTAPGIGLEVGSYAAGYRLFYQGLFLAPHTVAQALKSAVLSAKLFEELGMATTPAATAERADIIQAIDMGSADRLKAFCRAIQAASPVDSHAVPEPWAMPGYQDQVIMAAGTFVAGASIELSCDAPLREPYTAYLQGALTYAHGKIALTRALEAIFPDDAQG
ncbi:MAG: aminotransferase class I/II-fold pyridoxal phosphate-dependent enzyme [Christensenellales bacterium]